MSWPILLDNDFIFNLALDVTAQKMKFFIKDFFCKCDQICKKLRIRSHLRKKSFLEKFIFCAARILYLIIYIIETNWRSSYGNSIRMSTS